MESWDNLFNELKKEFVISALERLENIDNYLNTLLTNSLDSLTANKLTTQLHYNFHALTGSGRTYGFADISLLSAEAESFCQESLKDNCKLNIKQLERMKIICNKLKVDLIDSNKYDEINGKINNINIAFNNNLVNSNINLLIISEDKEYNQKIRESNLLVDSSIYQLDSFAKAKETLTNTLPKILIIDAQLPNSKSSELVEFVYKLPLGSNTKTIIINVNNDFLDKLEVIKSKATAYFEKPTNFDEVIALTKQFLNPENTSSKILYVEDDVNQALFLSLVLRSANYQIRICDNPNNFDTDLKEFLPDLIILDIFLPNATGYDLARYLRSSKEYRNIPILFLTTQRQVEIKFEAISSGGDSYLTKPVNPDVLIPTIKALLEKNRKSISISQTEEPLQKAISLESSFVTKENKASKKILIIDDDVTLANTLKVMFQTRAYQVMLEHDGKKGLNRASSYSPDLILLDVMLPVINGFDVARKLKEIDKTKDIPIIMFTTLGQEANISRGYSLGIEDYITKPFSLQHLLLKVNKWLDSDLG
ncbi:MAG: response regulator [Blastocatellia bacterium]|nr:response regulator [Blastocatellia bacterium]